MPTAVSPSPALPIAHIVLRILIVLNWVAGALILVLLFVVPTREWIMKSLELIPSSDAERVVWGLRAIAMLGLVGVPVNYGILKRLVSMVETVRAGDPFVAENARRLRAIAWLLVALQCVGILVGAIGKGISSVAPRIDIDAGFSLNGWLAVLLTFLLARVFSEGTRMRDDLEGMV